MAWKIWPKSFHGVENFFHGVEKNGPIFPWHGKRSSTFSTVWKTFSMAWKMGGKKAGMDEIGGR